MLYFTGVSQEQLRKTEGMLIPIVSLDTDHLPHILKHLLTLSEHDRYLRFGYTAADVHIQRYVDNMNFDRDEVYGIFNSDLEIIAMAHLALMKEADRDSSAEFGVSVASHARGRGYGARLFERAVIHARNEKVYQGGFKFQVQHWIEGSGV